MYVMVVKESWLHGGGNGIDCHVVMLRCRCSKAVTAACWWWDRVVLECQNDDNDDDAARYRTLRGACFLTGLPF